MKTQRGVIGTIVLIVIALILLGYFGISFKSIWNSPLVQDNLRYAWELFVHGVQAAFNWVVTTLENLVHSNSQPTT